MSRRVPLVAALLFLAGCGKKLDGVSGWAASQTNTCVITGGKIICWGSDFGKGSAVPIVGAEDAVEIASDNSTFYWRTGAGAVYAFSSNFVNLRENVDTRRGKVAILPIAASGAYALAENGVYLVTVGTRSERRRFALSPAPPAPPTVTYFDPIPLAQTGARPVGDGYLRDGVLAMPDVSIAHGPDEVVDGRRFVDRTGVNSRTHFLSDETGAVFAFQGRSSPEPLREIAELRGATSVVDTGDLRCAVFAGELRCSGNRRALAGATANGEATWKLVAIPFNERIREIGAGVGWLQNGFYESQVDSWAPRPPKERDLGVSGFVVAITERGNVYQWGDSDYGAINGKEGFVKEPFLVKIRRF